MVLKGSTARKDKTPSMSYAALRERLMSGSLFIDSPDPKLYELTKDLPFRSPSAAAVVMVGRNSNGRVEWKVEGTGQTYADWQDTTTPPAETEE